MSKHRNIPLYVLLIFQFFTACIPQVTPDLEGEHWVAFSAEHARESDLNQWLFTVDTEFWSPAEADIQAVESRVTAFLQENEAAFYTDIPVWERLDEYNRQYIGVVLEGRKVIYANYFCDSAGLDWKREFVFVMDGGACFFQFQFDPNTGEFQGLQVNGEA